MSGRFDCRGYLALLVFAVCCGCGTTTQRAGTEQLLMSDAVDLAISQIDFGPLAQQRIFLDSSFLQSVKGVGFVNAPYIISSLRQQLTAYGCLLQDNRDEADIIVEARVGALGTDGHEVIYGVPKNNLLSSASSVISNAPNIPAIPEISAARIDAQSGIAKMMVFAYDSDTREPIWQSGVARAESTSRNSWVLGAGPFQKGTVHDGTRFAGKKFEAPLPPISQFREAKARDNKTPKPDNGIGYFATHEFEKPAESEEDDSEPPVAKVAAKPDDEDKTDNGKGQPVP